MSVEIFACKNCSASLAFNIQVQKWKCEFCSAEFEKDEIKQKILSEHGVEKKEDLSVTIPPLDEYICNNCGSKILSEENIAATFCLYCKSPTIIKSRFSGEFHPQFIIPFKITPEQAEQHYFKWIKKKFFAPHSFKTAKEIHNIRGLYAPYWLFDCRTSGYIAGEGRTTRSWTSGNYSITETKYYDVKRSGYADYSKIPIDGSEYLDDDLMEGIEPYEFSEIKDFALEYMSGFLAEKWDVDEVKALPFMKTRAESFLENSLRQSGQQYGSFTLKSKNIAVNDVSAAYSMLPVYILTNLYKDKAHTFILNGQTGKIYGETPYDYLKMVLFFVFVFISTLIVSIITGGLINVLL